MGKKKVTVQDSDTTAASVVGDGSMWKKKGGVIDGDVYSVISTQVSEKHQNDDQEVAAAITCKKKKGVKRNTKKVKFKGHNEVEQDDEVAPVVITGRKKGKLNRGGGSVFTRLSFGLLKDQEELDDKSALHSGQSEEEDAPVVGLAGKTTKSSKKEKNSDAFGAINDDDGYDQGEVIDDVVEESKVREDDVEQVISFTGKKKSSKSTKKVGTGVLASTLDGLAEEEEDEKENDGLVSVVISSKKNKSSQDSKKSKTLLSEEGECIKDVSQTITGKEVTSMSKNKKKKKRGRTDQEEDELDKLLSVPGEGPPLKPSALPPFERKVPDQSEKEECVESSAAKKKKKKKEKEKEKKAVAATDASASGAAAAEGNKKLPKSVREKMQEALARRKAAEEMKKREEEEKSRKEEEERLWQEEIERQVEEIKRKKKEREKEKLLKKKKEGKLLTGKQKEEAKRLEAMRNQILANAVTIQLPTTDNAGTSTKRPIYSTKKARFTHNVEAPAEAVMHSEPQEIPQEAESATVSLESEKVIDVDLYKVEAEAAAVEEGETDDWDAKNWDGDDGKPPNTGAFNEKVEESEPEILVKKEIMKSIPTSHDDKSVPAPSSPAVTHNKISYEPPTKFDDFAGKKIQTGIEIRDETKKKEAVVKRNAEKIGLAPKATEGNLRSPICCIMGHVDAGKTKLLDCIRGTNIQEGEAGEITQQIGATYIPAEYIRDRTKELKANARVNVPGLIVLDTPGHQSFSNLRHRGSGLCDIAILVVDIMHGLKPQTIEALDLLKMRNTEFIVALNKVDRLNGWKSCKKKTIRHAIKEQSNSDFDKQLDNIILQFKQQGLNTELYYKNRAMEEYFNIVPTSAISGEGIPDLLLLLVQWTQKTMIEKRDQKFPLEKLTFRDELQCSVLEVKVIEGHGTTIDVVLVNGVLHEGDQIVVCGMQGPIVATIRALLTPHPMMELRVKGTYLHHKEIKAAQVIKISAQGLEHAVAGTGLYVVNPGDDLDEVKTFAMEDMKAVFSRIEISDEGVYVQASTIGSLEALNQYLKTPEVNVPVSGIGIGPVHKKDIIKASVMLEKKEYAAILPFDVKVTPEARDLAEELGVKIVTADIIYHLIDQFKAYIDNLKEEKKKEVADEAVFPCILKILPDCIFNKKDPIVLGVDVVEGVVKVGTPICIPSRQFIDIGRVSSIEINKKQVDLAKKGQSVAIKIIGSNAEEQQKMFGRHFGVEDELVSHITRSSIDVLNTYYQLTPDERKLLAMLKKVFQRLHVDCTF